MKSVLLRFTITAMKHMTKQLPEEIVYWAHASTSLLPLKRTEAEQEPGDGSLCRGHGEV